MLAPAAIYAKHNLSSEFLTTTSFLMQVP